MLRTKLIADSLSLIFTLPSLPDTQINGFGPFLSQEHFYSSYTFNPVLQCHLFNHAAIQSLPQLEICLLLIRQRQEVLSASGIARYPPQRRSWHMAECTHKGMYPNTSALTASVIVAMFFRCVMFLCHF